MSLPELFDRVRAALHPVVNVDPVGLSAIAPGYRGVDPGAPVRPQHVFGDWTSAITFADRHWGPGRYSVFIGNGRTEIVPNDPLHSEDRIVVPSRVDASSRPWIAALSGSAYEGRALHRLVKFGARAVDARIAEQLRAFASKRVSKETSESELGVNATGTQAYLKGARGESIELSLPESFEVELLTEAPLLAVSYRVAFYPWVTASGIEFETPDDWQAGVDRALLAAFVGLYPSQTCHFGKPVLKACPRIA